MALTDEQVKIRATGLGASELPAVCGLSPYASPIDVWLRKTGQAQGIEDAGPAEVGSILEPAILELYTRRTGHACTRPVETYRHPEHEWVLASPDAIADAGHLVEIKTVGVRMLHAWDEGPPDYVVAQTTQQMAVLDRERCDVAMLCGTDLQLYELRFDAGLWGDLYEIAAEFWQHVQDGTPPPPAVNESRREYLAKKFRGGRPDVIQVDDPHVVGLVMQYRAARDVLSRAEAALEVVEGEIKEIIGDCAGIAGAWGRASWATQQGAPSYKAIAEALAPMGVIPPALLDQYRGKPYRKFQVYGPKK